MSYLYCENCQLVFEGDRCPSCGRNRVREPLPNDPCFICEKQIMWGEMLAEALKNNGIPVILKKKMGMGMALSVGPLSERCKIYVPFSCMDDAMDICEELFSSDDFLS